MTREWKGMESRGTRGGGELMAATSPQLDLLERDDDLWNPVERVEEEELMATASPQPRVDLILISHVAVNTTTTSYSSHPPSYSGECPIRRGDGRPAMELLCKAPVLSCGARRGPGSPMGPLAGALGRWIYGAVKPPPPPPRICGTPGGPPVTAPRVRLSDGRHLAYAESGARKEDARYTVVFSHGFTGSRHDTIRPSPEVAEELGVYMVGFDRAGYGESDPNPNRSVKSAALDVEELADALGLGPKFYVIGISLGCHAVWGALKYIPERIAGAAMMAPVVNHWWPGFPADLAAEVYNKQEVGDQWALRVSHYAPGILHWWMDQSWLPTSTVVAGTTPLPNKRDAEIRAKLKADGTFQQKMELATQQGIHESYYRDMMVMFGKWEFDPMSLPKPPCPVHIWQGDEDGLVPVVLQRHIASRLSWVNYHELPKTGHFLSPVPGLGDTVLRTLFGNAKQ